MHFWTWGRLAGATQVPLTESLVAFAEDQHNYCSAVEGYQFEATRCVQLVDFSLCRSQSRASGERRTPLMVRLGMHALGLHSP
jgi:hypothetical protein